ncbi:MAG: lactonase family protein [Bacteroidota bacterium]
MKRFFFLGLMLVTQQLYSQNYNLLIGTYTNGGKSEGIYTYNFNAGNGQLQPKSVVRNVANPSFLAVSPDKKFVYGVNESGSNSTVTSFGYNSATGVLNPLNKRDAKGTDPCYVTADEVNVIIANYSSGSIAVYGRAADGSLTEPKQVVQHTGKSIDPTRQTSAHAHMVQFTPDKKHLICTDLGEDLMYVYTYNAGAKTNVLSLKTVVKTNAGTGPRHLAFSPNGKFAYLVHEFNGSITAFTYKNGAFSKIQEIGSTDTNFKGRVDAADIHISADGKFLYESNRGDANTISVYSIFPTGRLQFASRVSTLGKGPRNFAIDPSGKYLFVANQGSDEVVIFDRNVATGALKDSSKRIKVGSPVCLVFTALKMHDDKLIRE